MTHEQHSYRLTHGAYAAEILARGATLSRVTHEGRDLIAPADGPHAPGFAGSLLAPWPNRIVDGRYVFAGETRELPINEQARQHALHGFAHALAFTETTPHTSDSLELTATLEPSPGYPWRLQLTAFFSLDEAGLRYGITAQNLSQDPAPYGASTHPYLIAGPGSVDEWSLEMRVTERLEVSPDRLIPQRLAPWPPLTGLIGDARHDHAFTGIKWSAVGDASGTATARVTDGSGSGVALSWDQACPWVQVFTSDFGAEDPGDRAALAVEPMTCAPDAFNDSVYDFDSGLLTLPRGQTHTVQWRISAL